MGARGRLYLSKFRERPTDLRDRARRAEAAEMESPGCADGWGRYAPAERGGLFPADDELDIPEGTRTLEELDFLHHVSNAELLRGKQLQLWQDSNCKGSICDT